jgi:hypothetical protein
MVHCTMVHVRYSSTKWYQLVPWYYTCTYSSTYTVRTIISKTYHGTMVHVLEYHWYTCTYTCTNIPVVTLSQKRLEIQALSTVRTMVRTYTCTNTTLSQKLLEIQALRCNGDASGTRVVPWYHIGTRVPLVLQYVYTCTNTTRSTTRVLQ